MATGNPAPMLKNSIIMGLNLYWLIRGRSNCSLQGRIAEFKMSYLLYRIRYVIPLKTCVLKSVQQIVRASKQVGKNLFIK